MSVRARVRILSAIAVVAAAALVVGVVSATRQSTRRLSSPCGKTRAAALFVPGVKTRYEAEIRSAFELSAHRAAVTLEPLAESAPRDAVVQFNYGLQLFCAGYLADATTTFEAAKKDGRDTLYEMRADEILHPQYFVPADGLYPIFQPTRKNELLDAGVLLQRQGHQHSAEKLYLQAARARPNDDEAQVAAAVGRFDESNLSASFSRLGPLVRRFPRSESVRFHLGLLLAWTLQRTQAITEFRAAVQLAPGSVLGREATAFLKGLVQGRTGGLGK